MSDPTKRVEDLMIADLRAFPVWEYANSGKHGDTSLRRVKKTPVANLTGRLVGTQVRLANGAEVWALIGNVDANNPRLTLHFLTISLFRDEQWFTMARYHDFDATERGPAALAVFLGLRLDEVFPISYDISRWSLGDPGALVGSVEKEPREKFTRAQLITLAVP